MNSTKQIIFCFIYKGFLYTKYKALVSNGFLKLANKVLDHKDEDRDTSFQLLCSWLEGQAEVFTLPEIQEKMKSFSEPGEAQIVTQLEKKVQEACKDWIYFS